eukprot:8313225-Pyramimonas_sp.AAC.1
MLSGGSRGRFLGGAWTAARVGVAADAVAGQARGALVNVFCNARVRRKMARFDYAAHPEDTPVVLARALCHLLQCFYNLDAANAEAPGYRISPADAAACTETAEFAEAISDLAGLVQGQRRIAQIRAVLACYKEDQRCWACEKITGR